MKKMHSAVVTFLASFAATFIAAPAHSVSFVQTPFTTASVATADFSAVAGSNSTNPSSGFYAFEIENGPNIFWNSIGDAVPAEGVLKSSIDGSFGFQVASGYQITSLAVGAGGIWQSSGGAPVGMLMRITDDQANFVVDSRNFASVDAPTEYGGWKVYSSAFQYAPGLTSLSGNFEFRFNAVACDFCVSPTGDPYSSFIYGTNDEAFGPFPVGTVNGQLYRGPTVYVSVEQIVSSVPEPHEWALMLSGIAMVGALARKKKAVSQ
jgi:hypothetical protein